ncbi:MAG: DnaJ C-terminal domain-containing protein, partial [Candidatus Dormibacteria bacterium]
RVNEAYEVLKDPEKRSKYDRLGADWEQIERAQAYRREHAQPFPGRATRESANRAAGRAGTRFGGFSDFFETFFGTHQAEPQDDSWVDAQMEKLRRESGQASKGADTEDQLEVTLDEAMTGGERTMQVSIVEPCPNCGGSGRVAEPSGPGSSAQIEIHPCLICSGSGRQYRRKTLRVTVPKGVTQGSKIRVAGEGPSGSKGGRAGDLYLKVNLKLDPGTEVKGRNVYRELPVRDYRAALGGKVVAQGPGRVRLELTIPENCPPGRLLRIPGRGIPPLRASGEAGDLFLRVRVAAADHGPLSRAERAAYQELAVADGAPG